MIITIFYYFCAVKYIIDGVYTFTYSVSANNLWSNDAHRWLGSPRQALSRTGVYRRPDGDGSGHIDARARRELYLGNRGPWRHGDR